MNNEREINRGLRAERRALSRAMKSKSSSLTGIKGFGEGDPKPEGAKSKALKKRGNYSIFRYDAGGKYGEYPGKTRMKHNLSHGEMDNELKTNPAYRGTDKHGFMGGRTYKKK